jgi:2-oxoglutarate ferredoxin oxidoreductase subunit alpha
MLETAMNYRFYEYLKNDQADTLLIAYGIVFRVILPLKKEFSLFKPVSLFPVLEKEIQAAASGHKRIVVIEMNDGQYRGEVQKVLPREVLGIPVLGGTISLKEIRERLHDL